MSETRIFISLGAGVQSSTMALMAACGEITPMPAAAVFADTQAEPAEVYRWLAWLERELPFKVIRASKGNLGEAACRVRTSKGGKHYTKHSVPAFMADPETGRIGLAMRHCTSDFKLAVIYQTYRELGAGPRKPRIEQWIGISRDEAHRMKPSRLPWVENRWPLVDLGMTRQDCLRWMERHGYPQPPRSACVFCPYHSNAEWQRLKTEDPGSFEAAVQFEQRFQAAASRIPTWRGIPFLHRSCVPLSEADFGKGDPQLDLFGNECEGMCGL